MRSSSNRKEGCRVASPLSPPSVEATESALGLLPSIALSSAQFLLIIRVVRWRSLTAAGRSGAPSQLLRESNQQSEKPARKHFQWWYNWATRSHLEPMKKVAAMLKRRFENIITYLVHRPISPL